MKNSIVHKVSLWGMVLISWIATIVCYEYLPDKIPMHWNIYGQVDNWSDKFPGAFVFPAIVLIVAVLLTLVPKMDPKKKNYQKFISSYQWLKLVIVAVMFFINMVVLYASLSNGQVKVDVLIKLVIGILFIVIGNLLPKVKNNYFVGIRTPWTLSSDEVWFKTHRLGGIMFFISGIIMSLLAFVNGSVSAIIYFTFAILSGILPIAYSFVCYRKLKLSQK
jgi:uncharacterized membrane protein